MYESENNRKNCFCQMCQTITSKKYIEINDVQKNPKFEWDQMYLSLCLTCSKDYILLRNNNRVWQEFMVNILTTDVTGKETVFVKIGDNKSIAFTATHLAEIQTIIKLEVKNSKK